MALIHCIDDGVIAYCLIHEYSHVYVFSIFKGEHSYRASMYFILAPAVVCLIVLLVQSILSDTSVYGLQKLVTFQWDYLLDIKVCLLNLSYEGVSKSFQTELIMK